MLTQEKIEAMKNFEEQLYRMCELQNEEGRTTYLRTIPNKDIFIELKNNSLTKEEMAKQTKVNKWDINRKPYWYKYDEKWYYFKAIDRIEYLINELLGVKLAKEIKLPTVEYKLAKVKNGSFDMYGLMSELWIEEDKQYLKSNQLSKRIKMTNPRNLSILKRIVKDNENYKQLLIELYKLNILDFYISQIDRVPDNMIFVKSNNKLHLNKVFDYSASFNTLTSSRFYNRFRNVADMYSFYKPNNIGAHSYTCGNALFTLTYPSDKAIKIFNYQSELIETLEKLRNFNLMKAINGIEEELEIKLPSKMLQHYANEEYEKKEIIGNTLAMIKR